MNTNLVPRVNVKQLNCHSYLFGGEKKNSFLQWTNMDTSTNPVQNSRSRVIRLQIMDYVVLLCAFIWLHFV